MARVHVAAVAHLCRTHYRPAELARWTNQGPGLYTALVRSATVVVAERGGVVVGFAAVSLAAGVVRAVYVHPGHAGGGVGQRLLARIERAARVYGVRRLVLEATLNATRFYLRAGYRPVARTRSGLGLKCVRMAKVLWTPRRMPVPLGGHSQGGGGVRGRLRVAA